MEIRIGLVLWKSTQAFPRLEKCVILLPTFIQSCVKLHLMLRELFKLLSHGIFMKTINQHQSGWTVLLNSHCFTRDLRHTMWLNCCDLAVFCRIKMQRYELVVLLSLRKMRQPAQFSGNWFFQVVFWIFLLTGKVRLSSNFLRWL